MQIGLQKQHKYSYAAMLRHQKKSEELHLFTNSSKKIA